MNNVLQNNQPTSGAGLLNLEPDASEGLAAKSKLILQIRTVMRQAGFSEDSAANLLGLSAQELGTVLRGDMVCYSAAELFHFLDTLSRAAQEGRFAGRTSAEWARLHNILSDKPMTIEEIREETGLQKPCGDQLDELVGAGLVLKVNQKGETAYAVSPLQLEVEKLRAENRFLRHNLAKVLFRDDEKIDLDLDSLQKQCDKEGSLDRLIEDLENQAD